MRAPTVLILTSAVAAIAFPTVATAASRRAPTAANAVDPLARARDAETRFDFEGDVVVSWTDATGHHSARMPVTSEAGIVRVDGARSVLGDGERRYLGGAGGWHLAWSGRDDEKRPALAAKYIVRTAPSGTPVAGHVAERFEVRLRVGGALRERIALDADTGLLLRRDQLDDRGRVARSIRFATLRVTPRKTVSTAATTPSTIARLDPVRSTNRVREPYHAPARAGRGFVRIGAYETRNGGLQLAYTDGLQDVSVFERRGSLDWDALPDGRRISVDGHAARVYTSAGSSVVVWEDDGVVYTYVGDPPWSEATDVVGAFPRGHARGTLAEIGHFVTAPFRWT